MPEGNEDGRNAVLAGGIHMSQYVLGVDQSTQGTKALLFDGEGSLMGRADLPHRQIINEHGWVSHDPEEIYANTLQVIRKVVDQAKIDPGDIAAIGISNQRETSVAFDRNGHSIVDAIVWQCSRAEAICERVRAEEKEEKIRRKTGLQLSPYFPASKFSWILENIPEAEKMAREGNLCFGTMDTYLIYRLTRGREFRTDYSNASRTQLFNIHTLEWDSDICKMFGIPEECLPEVTDSDALFGKTDLEGYLPKEIPICGVLGDSHAALFGQGCHAKGTVKATYGTGSSIMMNIGDKPILSSHGVVTSLAWRLGGHTQYVLEGNINYAGAVITWLKDDLKLISSAGETEEFAKQANPKDHSYFVPAFTGLGAPYWDSKAEGILCGMTRTTGRAEVIRDALQCIAYQITDVLRAMEEDAGIPVAELRTDGGPTRNKWLMRFQSDIAEVPVRVSAVEELSGMGAAYAAGISAGVYQKKKLFCNRPSEDYHPQMQRETSEEFYAGWKKAVQRVLLNP